MNQTNNSHGLETFFKLNFNDKNLLETALTHSSFANENHTDSNERLEYIGDAVLDLVVGKYLYDNYPHYHEGELTKRRAKHVCESALVDYANACDLGKYLLLGHGEEKTGGRTRSALLADAFEAFIGAVFLDKGLKEIYKIANKVIFPLIEEERATDFIDYKSHLQELVQSDKRTLEYRIVSETGPSHQKTFVTRVYMDEILMGEGKGHSKKEAEQHAAEIALKKLAKKSIKF
ncbi:MAG: ribonuclease III [Candidatus Izemoplasmataceae bacterium]